MFPLRDDIPSLGTPLVTVAIIWLNVLVWLTVQGMGAEPALSHSVCVYGLIPGELLRHLTPGMRVPVGPQVSCVIGAPNWWTALTSMFMHGGWFHVIGNMWFLWVFGDNVEDAMGRGRFAIFYLLCGLAAAAVQTAANPGSRMPMVGASGAIGGVMGAYAVLYPRARVLTAIVFGFFVRTVWVPAWLMLGYWFLLQFIGGLPSRGSEEGGVAFWAHIGGFAAGVVLAFVMRNPARTAPRESLA
jgi:membrane associated rhomboid family serine protease